MEGLLLTDGQRRATGLPKDCYSKAFRSRTASAPFGCSIRWMNNLRAEAGLLTRAGDRRRESMAKQKYQQKAKDSLVSRSLSEDLLLLLFCVCCSVLILRYPSYSGILTPIVVALSLYISDLAISFPPLLSLFLSHSRASSCGHASLTVGVIARRPSGLVGVST